MGNGGAFDRSIDYTLKKFQRSGGEPLHLAWVFSKIHSTQRQWRYSYAGDNEILRVDQGVEKMRVNCVFRISFVLTHHSSMYLQVKKWCIFL